MEEHLYKQLKKFNQTVENPYRKNWGSTLTFLNTAYNFNGKDQDEVSIANQYLDKIQQTDQIKISSQVISKDNKSYYKKRRSSQRQFQQSHQNQLSQYKPTEIQANNIIQSQLNSNPLPTDLNQAQQDENIIVSENLENTGNGKIRIIKSYQNFNQRNIQGKHFTKIEDQLDREKHISAPKIQQEEHGYIFRQQIDRPHTQGGTKIHSRNDQSSVSFTNNKQLKNQEFRRKSTIINDQIRKNDKSGIEFSPDQTDASSNIMVSQLIKSQNRAKESITQNPSMNLKKQLRQMNNFKRLQNQTIMNEDTKNDLQFMNYDDYNNIKTQFNSTIGQSIVSQNQIFKESTSKIKFQSIENKQEDEVNDYVQDREVNKKYIRSLQDKIMQVQSKKDYFSQQIFINDKDENSTKQVNQIKDDQSQMLKLQNDNISNNKNIFQARNLLLKKLGGSKNVQNEEKSEFQEKKSYLSSLQINMMKNVKLDRSVQNKSELAQDYFFVNQNNRRQVELLIKNQNKNKLIHQEKLDTFSLQESIRLSHKFSGSTTIRGKKNQEKRMKIEPGAAQSFQEQKKILIEINRKSKSSIADQIQRETSVKQNVIRIVENQMKQSGNQEDIDILQEKEQNKAVNFKAASFDPRSINVNNKLQIAIIKTGENAKKESFNFQFDPLDQYLQIRNKTQSLKDQMLSFQKKEIIKSKAQLDRESLVLKLKEFRDKREIYHHTPRKFDKIKDVATEQNVYVQKNESQNDLAEASRIPKNINNEIAIKDLELKMKAIKEVSKTREMISPQQTKIDKMPLELRALLDVDPEEQNCIYKLLGYTKKLFMLYLNMIKFCDKHKLSTEQQKLIVSNIKFSKDFFNIIDEHGDGGISLEDLSQPLIALGLATDSGFVQKSLKALNPKKYGGGNFDQDLTIQEFSRIFRTDSVSDKLIKLIKDTLDSVDQNKQNQNRFKQQDQQHKQQHSVQQNCIECQKYKNQQMCHLHQIENEQQKSSSIQFANMFDEEFLLSTDDNIKNKNDPLKKVKSTSKDINDHNYISKSILSDQTKNNFYIQKVEIQEQGGDNYKDEQFDDGFFSNIKIVQDQYSNSKKVLSDFNNQDIQDSPAKTINTLKNSQKKKIVEKQKKRVYDINDQVNVLKLWWKELGKNEENDQNSDSKHSEQNLQVELLKVSKKLVEWKIFQDLTSARKYLLNIYQGNKSQNDESTNKSEKKAKIKKQNADGDPLFEFNDFLAIFLKAIFKDVVCSIAITVQNYKRKDQQNESDEFIQGRSLLWKLSDFKRENMFDLIEKGMIKYKTDAPKMVQRPIFQNLYKLKVQGDPDEWKNIKYDDYLQETVNKKFEIYDHLKIHYDQYNNVLNFIGSDFYKKEIQIYDEIQDKELQLNVNNQQELQILFQDIIDKKSNILKNFNQNLHKKNQTAVQLKEKSSSLPLKTEKINFNKEKTTQAEIEREQNFKNLMDLLYEKELQFKTKQEEQNEILQKHVQKEYLKKIYNYPELEEQIEKQGICHILKELIDDDEFDIEAVYNIEKSNIAIKKVVDQARIQFKDKFDLMQKFQSNFNIQTELQQ